MIYAAVPRETAKDFLPAGFQTERKWAVSVPDKRTDSSGCLSPAAADELKVRNRRRASSAPAHPKSYFPFPSHREVKFCLPVSYAEGGLLGSMSSSSFVLMFPHGRSPSLSFVSISPTTDDDAG